MKLEKPKCKRDFGEKSTIDRKPTSIEKSNIVFEYRINTETEMFDVQACKTLDFAVVLSILFILLLNTP